jgi:pimeloyl-ACP methyl ester carboxylesterase
LIAALLRTVLAFSSVVWRVTGREPSGMQRLIGNADILFRRELPAFVYDYEPAIAALRSVQVPWCLATGRDSLGRPYYRPAHVLSDELGVTCEEFPGGHTVYQQHPEEFTSRLTEILDQLHQ